MKKQKATKTPSVWRHLVRFGLLAGAIAAVAVALYVVHLDRLITSTFDGRRWSIPAHVYASPFEIYTGRSLAAEGLVRELQRLGYAQGDGHRAGTWQRSGSTVRAGLRSFRFLDAARPESRVQVDFKGNRVVALAQDGQRVALVRLEPALIGSFFPSHGEDRQIIAPDETPALLSDALIAVEDRQFRQHPGFDIRGIARAFWVNLRAGEVQQGGSTLTQQLVKSYFLDNRRTLPRKLKELVMAVVLELRYSKDELLNAYINEIFIGQDGTRAVHGFGLGSQFYFGKPLQELKVEEIAVLVAVIRGPSWYNPYSHPLRATERRNRVLEQMRDAGLITEAAYTSARNKPLLLAGGTRGGGRYYPAFMELVRRQLSRDYDRADLESVGLRIFTTLNPWVQDAVEESVTQVLDATEQRRGLPANGLEAAVIVSHAQTGEIRALVGGRRPGFQGFNRALDARRPVGSLLKPVVYLAALESGRFHLASIVDDGPVAVPRPGEPVWRPQNFDNQSHGPVPLVRALGDSLNLATVHLGLDVGVDAVAQRVATLAAVSKPEAYPSLLLGALSLTPLETLRLYGVIANGGFTAQEKAVVAVVDTAGRSLKRYPIDVAQSIDHERVQELTQALQVVMAKGTGRSSRFSKVGVAGKTGTSDDYRDSWFAGFDAEHLALVWVGYDDNHSTGLTGAAGALGIWDALMTRIGVVPLPEPNTTLANVDYQTGMRANEGCGDIVQLHLPRDASLAQKPGCSMAVDNLVRRVRKWFER